MIRAEHRTTAAAGCVGTVRKPDGRPTSTINKCTSYLSPLRKLYSMTPAADFGPQALKQVREAMIERL